MRDRASSATKSSPSALPGRQTRRQRLDPRSSQQSTGKSSGSRSFALPLAATAGSSGGDASSRRGLRGGGGVEVSPDAAGRSRRGFAGCCPGKGSSPGSRFGDRLGCCSCLIGFAWVTWPLGLASVTGASLGPSRRLACRLLPSTTQARHRDAVRRSPPGPHRVRRNGGTPPGRATGHEVGTTPSGVSGGRDAAERMTTDGAGLAAAPPRGSRARRPSKRVAGADISTPTRRGSSPARARPRGLRTGRSSPPVVSTTCCSLDPPSSAQSPGSAVSTGRAAVGVVAVVRAGSVGNEVLFLWRGCPAAVTLIGGGI